MLNLERIQKLKSIIAEKSSAEQPVQNINNSLKSDSTDLSKLNSKWKKLLDEYKDVDMSQYINNNTKYDEFGLPIIDFDKKEEFNELPKINQFGISE